MASTPYSCMMRCGFFCSRSKSNSFFSKISTALFNDHPGMSGREIPSLRSSQKHCGHSKKRAIFDLLILKGAFAAGLYTFELRLFAMLFKSQPLIIFQEIFKVLAGYWFYAAKVFAV